MLGRETRGEELAFMPDDDTLTFLSCKGTCTAEHDIADGLGGPSTRWPAYHHRVCSTEPRLPRSYLRISWLHAMVSCPAQSEVEC